MPKINHYPDLGNIKDPDEFMKHASPVIKGIADIVNGKLGFDNMNTQTVTVTFPSANTDVVVPHTLNKMGVHYLPAKKSVACDIFDGTGVASINKIYLQSSVAATVTLILY